MADRIIQTGTLTAIADAIREMLGTDDTYTPGDMPDAIRSITASFDLPAYWESYLDGKADEIRTKLRTKTATTAVFGFFSDAHVLFRNSSNAQVEGNAGHTGEIMRYLAAKAGVRRWIFGGDALAYENTQALVEQSFETVSSWLAPISKRIIVKGNHDLNPYGNPTLTDAQYRSMFFDTLMPDADAAYYYVDDADTQTRYIVVDTRETSINYSYTNGDSTEKAYVAAEIAWLYGALNGTPSGWQIIVLPHAVWWGGGNMANGSLTLSDSGTDLVELCGAYNTRSSGTKWGQAYDFSGGAAKVGIVLSGHTHIDYSRVYGNVVAASITADSYQYANARPDSRAHTKGTVTEQAIDVWFVDTANGTAESIRIGCGVGRTFDIGGASNGQVCTITNTLTNCTTNNNAATAKGGYSATITATSGTFTNGVYRVLCNGYDITANYCTVSQNGTVLTINTGSILPGDIEIIATASTVPVYTITNDLTRASTSNNAAQAEQGSAYTATITPNAGYSLDTLRVTMGGADITASVVTRTAQTIANEYRITNNLTHTTNSNTATSVTEGQGYQATIAAASGYNLVGVTVTMGGVDVTATVYTRGTINIPSVTGNVVITAIAEEITSYTNRVRQSVEVGSTAVYNGGLGYKNGYYLSNGEESANAADCMTGCIQYVIGSSQPTDVLYIKGYTGAANASHTRLDIRNASKTKIGEWNGFLTSNNIFDVETLGTGYYKLTPKTGVHNNYTIAYVQFSFNQADGSGIVITKNEPIE